MNQGDKTRRLADSRTAVIDDELAGRPLRLSIMGKPLRTRLGQAWATTLFKSRDAVEFSSKAGQALDKTARPMDGFGFILQNTTDKTVSLEGFPAIAPKSSASIGLKNGKWEASQ